MDKQDKWNINHKKERNLTIYKNMNGSTGHHAVWNKSDREIQVSYDCTYMLNLKNKMNKTKLDSQIREQTDGC